MKNHATEVTIHNLIKPERLGIAHTRLRLRVCSICNSFNKRDKRVLNTYGGRFVEQPHVALTDVRGRGAPVAPLQGQDYGASTANDDMALSQSTRLWCY